MKMTKKTKTATAASEAKIVNQAKRVSRSIGACSGHRQAALLIQDSRRVSADEASIEPEFRSAPQNNFALRRLQKLLAAGDPAAI